MTDDNTFKFDFREGFTPIADPVTQEDYHSLTDYLKLGGFPEEPALTYQPNEWGHSLDLYRKPEGHDTEHEWLAIHDFGATSYFVFLEDYPSLLGYVHQAVAVCQMKMPD
jgi:hypothetical protein